MELIQWFLFGIYVYVIDMYGFVLSVADGTLQDDYELVTPRITNLEFDDDHSLHGLLEWRQCHS